MVLSKCYPHLNLLPLITNDEDNIRRVDSDNLDGKRRRQAACASFDQCRPSCNSLDRDNRLMDPDACTLESEEFRLNKTCKIVALLNRKIGEIHWSEQKHLAKSNRSTLMKYEKKTRRLREATNKMKSPAASFAGEPKPLRLPLMRGEIECVSEKPFQVKIFRIAFPVSVRAPNSAIIHFPCSLSQHSISNAFICKDSCALCCFGVYIFTVISSAPDL